MTSHTGDDKGTPDTSSKLQPRFIIFIVVVTVASSLEELSAFLAGVALALRYYLKPVSHNDLKVRPTDLEVLGNASNDKSKTRMAAPSSASSVF